MFEPIAKKFRTGGQSATPTVVPDLAQICAREGGLWANV